MLVDHADAQRISVVGVLDTDLLAILFDHAFLRLVQAEQDAHQSRLSCTVFAQKRMDLALSELQGNIIICDDTRELLGDVQHLNGILLPQVDPLLLRI